MQEGRAHHKEGKLPGNEKDEGKGEVGGEWKSPGMTCLHVYKNRPTHAVTSWYDWGSPGVWTLPVLSLPHPDLLRSSLTTQNERNTCF